MDILVSGLGLVESPQWHEDRIWFSDWTHGRILAVDDRDRVEVVVEHTSLPLCFDFLPDGRLVLVSNQVHALLVRESDGTLASYADLAGLSSYGHNDIVVAAHWPGPAALASFADWDGQLLRVGLG